MRRKFEDIFGLDVRSLAMLRIGLGLLILCDIAVRYPHLEALYSDDGVYPIRILRENPAQINVPISIHLLDGSLLYQAILCYIEGFVALALIAGWLTRYMIPLAWFLTISVHARNPLLVTGGDAVVRSVLFWSMFLPLGACWSIDSMTRPKPPKRVLSMGSVALIVQICMVYWFAALHKWHPVWREDGYAVWMALNVGYFTTALGQALLEHHSLLTFLTHATILLEGFGTFLLFIPWRTWLFRLVAIVAFLGFHASLGLTMELGNFQPACMVMWLVLLPTEFWDWLARKRRSKLQDGVVIVRHPESGRQHESIRFWTTFLMLTDLPVETSGDRLAKDGSWVVVDGEKRERVGYDAVVLLMRLSPLFRPLGWLLSREWLRSLASKMKGRGRATAAPPEPDQPSSVQPLSGPMNLLIGSLIVYSLVWNVSSWHEPNDPKENPHNWVYTRLLDFRDFVRERVVPQTMLLAYAIGIEQDWSVFAPAPGIYHGWYVTVGMLADGRRVDLLRHGEPVTWEKPERISTMFPNNRWRKYYMNLAAADPRTGMSYAVHHNFMLWLAHRWDVQHPDKKEQLESLELWLMEEATQPDYKPNKLEKVRLCKLNCRTTPPLSDLTRVRSAP